MNKYIVYISIENQDTGEVIDQVSEEFDKLTIGVIRARVDEAVSELILPKETE